MECETAVPHDGIECSALHLLCHDNLVYDGSHVASQQELSLVPCDGRQQTPCRLSVVEVSSEFTLGAERIATSVSCCQFGWSVLLG